MIERFDIELMEEAAAFLDGLPAKSREKLHGGSHLRFLAFWVHRNGQRTLVLATHGFIKKTSKVPAREIEHAMNLRQQYLKNP